MLREAISDKEIEEMGLSALIVMHEPIFASDGYPNVLCVRRYGGGLWLYAYNGRPGIRWPRGVGFVFLAPRA